MSLTRRINRANQERKRLGKARIIRTCNIHQARILEAIANGRIQIEGVSRTHAAKWTQGWHEDRSTGMGRVYRNLVADHQVPVRVRFGGFC